MKHPRLTQKSFLTVDTPCVFRVYDELGNELACMMSHARAKALVAEKKARTLGSQRCVVGIRLLVTEAEAFALPQKSKMPKAASYSDDTECKENPRGVWKHRKDLIPGRHYFTQVLRSATSVEPCR